MKQILIVKKAKIINKITDNNKNIKYVLIYTDNTKEIISESDLLDQIHCYTDKNGIKHQLILTNAKEDKDGHIILEME